MTTWTPQAGKRAWVTYLQSNADVIRLYPKTATVRVACGGLRDGEYMTIRGVRLSALERPHTLTEIQAMRSTRDNPEEEFDTKRCSFCGGPFHPATGCTYGDRVVSCRSCTVEAWSWIKKHTSSKAKRNHPSVVDFYTSAGKHVRR